MRWLYESNLYDLYDCSKSDLSKSRFPIGQFISKSLKIIGEHSFWIPPKENVMDTELI